MKKKQIILILVLFIFIPLTVSHAVPSLDPKDVMEFYLKYKDGGKTVNGIFTVLRDCDDFNSYYYLPNYPKLCLNSKGIPEFTLIKYQDIDPENKKKLVEGGILQFACSLDLPEDARKNLKPLIVKAMKSRIGWLQDQINREKKNTKWRIDEVSKFWKRSVKEKEAWIKQISQLDKKNINLKMIPLKDTEVTLYTPGGDIVESAEGPSIAPSHAGGKMPFSLTLNKLGTNVYKTLTESNTGIPVLVKYTYSGLSPASNIRIQVDWETLYMHLSGAHKGKVMAKYNGFGINETGEAESFIEELMANKCIKIMTVANEGYEKDELLRIVDPLLARINKELYVNAAAPEKIEPAKAKFDSESKKKESGIIGKFMGLLTAPSDDDTPVALSHKSQSQLKTATVIKRGKEIIDFTGRSSIDRVSIASAFIGIGEYPESVKAKCSVTVKRGGWENGVFVLPIIGDEILNLGVKSVDITVTVLTPDKKENQIKTAKFYNGNWFSRDETISYMIFPLMDLFDKYGESRMKSQAKYKMEIQFTLGRESFVAEQKIPVFDGEKPIASPLNLIKPVKINFNSLRFHSEEDNEATLESIDIKLKSGSRSIQTATPVHLENGKIHPEIYRNGFFWLFDNSKELRADITFSYRDPFSDKKNVKSRKLYKHEWKYNGINLNAPLKPEYRKSYKSGIKRIKKMFTTANKKKDKNDQFKQYLKAFDKYYDYIQIENVKKSKRKKQKEINTSGIIVNLDDARLEDTGFSKGKDDKVAIKKLLFKKLENGKTVTEHNFQEVLTNVLWTQYNRTDDDDDDWPFEFN